MEGFDSAGLERLLTRGGKEARDAWRTITKAGMSDQELAYRLVCVAAAIYIEADPTGLGVSPRGLLGVAAVALRSRKKGPSLSDEVRRLAEQMERMNESPIFRDAKVRRRGRSFASLAGIPTVRPFRVRAVSLDADLPSRMRQWADDIDSLSLRLRRTRPRRGAGLVLQQEVLLLDAVKAATGNRKPTAVITLLGTFCRLLKKHPYRTGHDAVRALVARCDRFQKQKRGAFPLLSRSYVPSKMVLAYLALRRS